MQFCLRDPVSPHFVPPPGRACPALGFRTPIFPDSAARFQASGAKIAAQTAAEAPVFQSSEEAEECAPGRASPVRLPGTSL